MTKMSDCIELAFQVFDAKIAIGEAERKVALDRAQAIADVLTEDPDVQHCVTTGSLIKTTALSKLSDVDMLAVFNSSFTAKNLTPKFALERLASALSEHFPSAFISGNTVCVKFDVGPTVDVLPAIPFIKRRDVIQSYLIPGAKQTIWRRFSPEEQNLQIRQASAELGPNFKRVIRIIKWWSKNSYNPIGSYEIETIAKATFTQMMPNISFAIDKFFKSPLLESSLSNKEEAAIASMAQGVRDAITLEGRGEITQASTIWRRILGEQFAVDCG